MKKQVCSLLLLSSSTIFAQVIDNVKYVWRPGFSFGPKIQMTSISDQSKSKIASYELKTTPVSDATNNLGANGEYYQSTNIDLQKSNFISYGIKFDWNSVLLSQWYNTLSFDYDLLKPKYGKKMERYNDASYQNNSKFEDLPINNTDKAESSFDMKIQDTILHANHNWGSVLPFAGIGAEFIKIGGHLAYVNGNQSSTQILYSPLGAYFQMSSGISGKVQLNIPLSAKTKFHLQKSKVVDVSNVKYHNFSFDESNAANTYSHDLKSSLGFEFSMLVNSKVIGSNVLLEPYIKVWHLDDNDKTPAYNRRLRSLGVIAKFTF